jgi:choline/glycine/proline betaine transport protein
VAEPVMHWSDPPFAATAEGGPVREALRLSFFHWGFHPWAIYIVFGLSIAYFHFRHELPLAPRSLLYPLIGKRIFGPIGHAVDILATVGTLFGVATSLGLGAIQINAGLGRLSGLPQAALAQVAIIAVITMMATISVVTGVHRGIRLLSRLNLGLAGVLLLFVFIASPTVYLIKLFISASGAYLQQFVSQSLWLDLRPESQWQFDWTLFYWSWWISWSPFVGIFLGDSGIESVVQQNASAGLYAMLDQLPLQTFTSILATLMVVVFFVTSSDSGSLVDDMVTSGGHPHPPKAQRIFWAVAEGTVAATLLLSGGLQALRTASLTSGLPMTAFLLIACWGLLKALRADEQVAGIPSRKALRD